MPPKSARYQFNWELEDNTPLRNPAIPGGKKAGRPKKGGRMGNSPSDMVPTEHQIEISGGKLINDGRGNLKETDEATKDLSGGKKGPGRPKKAAGLFGTLGSAADSITSILGLGKKPTMEQMEEIKAAGLFGTLGDAADSITGLLGLGKKPTKKQMEKMKAAGLFGTLGSAADSITGLLGLGKKGGAMNDSFVGVKSGVRQGEPALEMNVGGMQSGALPTTLTEANQQKMIDMDTGLPKKGGAKEKRARHKAGLISSVSNMENQIKQLKKELKKLK